MSTIMFDLSDGHQRLGLPASLDLRATKPLKVALGEALERNLPIVIDAGSVERVSTTCAQVVVAFEMAARRAGVAVTFRRPSVAFSAAFQNLGLGLIVSRWNLEGGI
jgi:chemotaxis protein CheX